jgi:hypothetical protein
MKRSTTDFFPGNDPKVNAGDLYADDHPYVKSYPGNFEDPVVIEAPGRKTAQHRPEVEQATAAPGEKRGR